MVQCTVYQCNLDVPEEGQNRCNSDSSGDEDGSAVGEDALVRRGKGTRKLNLQCNRNWRSFIRFICRLMLWYNWCNFIFHPMFHLLLTDAFFQFACGKAQETSENKSKCETATLRNKRQSNFNVTFVFTLYK